MQSNHARRPNGTTTFSVSVGIVGVSELRHETSSNLLAPTPAGPCVDVLVRGTARSPRVEERRQLRPETLETGWHISTRYDGAHAYYY